MYTDFFWTAHGKKSREKMTKKIDRSFCICYLCLLVCLSVRSLQVTVFVVGSWFLAWGILEWIPQNSNFCFWKFWDLTYLWLFLDFLGVFCYISFVNFERVCRPNQMTQRLEICYMGSLYSHELIPEISYQYSENNFRFWGKN